MYLMQTETNTDITGRKLVEVYTWQSQLAGAWRMGLYGRMVESREAGKPQWGDFLGYAVSSNGKHRACLRGPVRPTLEAAALDLANPDLVFTITGYSCG